MQTIKNRIYESLNKQVNDVLVNQIIDFSSKSLDEFSNFVKLIGVKDGEDLYKFIHDNKDGANDNDEPSKMRPNSAGESNGLTKRKIDVVDGEKSKVKNNSINFDELDEQPKIRPKNLINYDELDLIVPKRKLEQKTTKRLFKKIKKEDAIRLKEVPKEERRFIPQVDELVEEEVVKVTPKKKESKIEEFKFDLSKLDSSKVQITNSYFFVPPFLKDQKEYLQVFGSRSIDPTINPIKDTSSELASMASQGSISVANRRSKKEKAKHVKERAGIVEEEEEEQQQEEEIVQETITSPNLRKTLPVYSVRDDLITTIRDNQVVIVIGETGSGKTTQLTQYLYEEGFGSIACTQPRRVAAMSVAKRVSEEMACKLGDLVGYSIRFEDKTNDNTKIKYMTEGILLREILADPNLTNYNCIIMDEAHERSLNTDILLGLFRNLIMKRKDLKLIVTSATMNANRFTKFFGAAPQFTIPGRTFPVDVFFNKSVVIDYVENAVKQILSIHLKNSQNKSYTNDGDILVFMTGQEDIETCCDLLKEKLSLINAPPIDIYPIYSSMSQDLQKRIFRPKNEKRKVVIATNIAETSLTVDGIKYVIDSGLVKVKVFNPKLGMDTLQIVPISLANANQRSGRAGRTGPGICYRLYTESSIDQIYKQPIPEIQRTNLSNTMLLLKSLNIDILKFPFLDPPPKDLLTCSLYELWSISALDNFGELTELGKQMTQFPIEPTLSKLILLSTKFKCSEDIITIVAMLSVPNIFHRPKERAQEADAAREKFIVSESDHLTLCNVFNQFNNIKRNPNQWCDKNFLNCKSLLRAREIRTQLILIMKNLKIPLLHSTDEAVRKCLSASFYQQSAKISKMNINGNPEFINLRHSYMKMYLHPTSVLLNSNLSSNYVIYHELILTSREYMNYATTVEPIWLLEYGYKFFNEEFGKYISTQEL
ncbi:unnamed protein product [Candida verbasci]|uniref:Pre-mRNA-splicing factor ATP-dependent RNA helicase PRP16 n=1 Tax=Candida verbasci TaxID=1227364 RepID=A0A9W4XEE5_9ASCO|nr:unnamed protein product [Candida verbasci]